MTEKERIEELRNALGSIYRVRMNSSYDEVGRDGASEIVLAEVLVHRAIQRARGHVHVGPLPKTVTALRRELETAGR